MSKGHLICWFLILLGSTNLVSRTNGARILGLFPLNGKSHFVMFQAVMKSLVEKGHQVDVLSTFPQEKKYPNYTDLSIADLAPVKVNNMTYEFVKLISGSSEKVLIEETGNDVCNFLQSDQLQKLIKHPPNDPPYDLIIAELFYANCYFAFGRHLNVPIIGMTSSPMLPYTNEPLGNPLNTAVVSEISDGSESYMNFWQRLKNTLVTWSVCFQSRYYTEIQSEIVRKYFGSKMPGIRELERDLALLLVNSHFTLNGIRPFTPAVVEVGGLHVRDDNTTLPTKLQKWLDESKNGFIYFSFGSMVMIETFPKETIRELYAAFSRIAPIRVLMKSAKPELLPPGLPKNVLTVKWASQIKVLKHENIRAFITHGGLLGVQEAVTFGVPLIGVPLYRDQPSNIRSCSNKGAAIFLNQEDLTEEKIVASINAVVHDPKYKKNMMELSVRFLDRPMSARDTAVFWIEYILKYGGDSLRSPAVALTWWQLRLFDVYGSILAVILATLFIIKSLFSKIFCNVIYVRRSSLSLKKNN